MGDDREFLQALLVHSSDFIYFKDRQSRFLRCSPAVYERFGLALTDFLGKTDFDFFDEVHARRAFEDEQRIMQTGQGFKDKVEREILKDGTERWALTSKMPLFNKAGEIIGTFGVNKDITDLKQTEANLAYQRDLLTTLLDNSPDFIYFKDLESRFVRVSRSKVESTLDFVRAGYDTSAGQTELPKHLANSVAFAEYLLGKTDFDTFSEERAREAFEDEQHIIRTGEAVPGKLEKSVRPDGRLRWVVSTKMPWFGPDGRIIGTFGVSKDVTFIKEAEVKLEQVNRKLIETSRLAGMAEVATTVLHNVGNVLNSVNISASVVAEKVQHSKISNLSRVADMIREHSADLPEFLTKDPKGAKLPEYLGTLAARLAEEQKEVVEELSSLRANIDHIKEIVAMQQAYAKVAGVRETLNPTDLIEDSLRLNAGACERHRIHLVREFAPVPMILVDKHKVLQILVNLIRNAKYALDDSKSGDKTMTLGIGLAGEGMVKISVKDNGIGIAPKNITRIFEHGFTTRANGHGFALHSGALAAREMGGSLKAYSDGPGKGAIFILELPFNPPEMIEEILG